ncbi:MAG: helix-turn-helix domain-containing protein [Ktedonobacteraceae bacterium]
MRITTESFHLPQDYAKRIKALRDRFGLSQQQLAGLLAVSLPLVRQWEQGRSRPPIQYWEQIVLAEVDGVQALRHNGQRKTIINEARSGYAFATNTAPSLDFTARPDVVRAVVEGERLTYGHLFNPAFATEISLIEPLPHQRIAVYEHMLKQSRLRFLLADDAGAGKTIMTGLYIREMLTRRLI